jgi:integrase
MRIDTRTKRRKLAYQRAPYWHKLERGLAVGYYRPASGVGTWWARARVGEAYKVAALGNADDAAGSGLDWGQAQTAAREWRARIDDPLRSEPEGYTVEMALTEYIADLRARKGEKAAREVQGRLAKHMPAELRAREVTKLSAGDLIGWRNSMVNTAGDEETTRRSRDSANRVLKMAKAAFNFAFQGSKIADDRAWRRVAPFGAVGEARKVVLDDRELQRLVDACEPSLRELVLLGALLGCRLGELTAATVRDFDPAAAVLVVSGKTGTRPVHLPPAAVSVLRGLAAGRGPADYLCTTTTGGPWVHGLHTRRFVAAVARAGLDPDTTYYALRHSWITRALERGVPVKAVADHCGTSMAMLEKHYAKSIKSEQPRYAALTAPVLKIYGT